MPKILVVEDNKETAASLEAVLTLENYMVDVLNDGSEALIRLKDYEYDLLILDWNMPGLSGPEVCRQYRQQKGTAAILLLTGNSSENDKEFGLDNGADDYLTKPYGLKELMARVRALLRRTTAQSSPNLRVGALELQPESRLVFLNGTEIRLLPKEFALLEFFMRHTNQVFTADQLLHRVWDTDSESGTDSLRSTLRRLRQKIDALDAKESLIETMPGFGFRMRK